MFEEPGAQRFSPSEHSSEQGMQSPPKQNWPVEQVVPQPPQL
jgi:hypothetical protein